MSCCNATTQQNSACCTPMQTSACDLSKISTPPTCCASTQSTPPNPSSNNIKGLVQDQYAAMARFHSASSTAGISSWAEATAEIAKSFGYSAEDLASSIPAEANLGLSCGNPIAISLLKEGEVVVDLGSGAGMDCFLAATKVGPSGKVIGIDMTPDMLVSARKNAANKQATNVQFIEGDIENIPLHDATADVVISNCVINLVPNKLKAFQEIHRILKQGGRVAISDIVLKAELPDHIKANPDLYIACVAGAIPLPALSKIMNEVGFTNVSIVDSNADLNVYKQLGVGAVGCCSTPCVPSMVATFDALDLNTYAVSVKIFAKK